MYCSKNSIQNLRCEFLRCESGLSILQFTLVMPLVFALILGIMDISRIAAITAIINKGAEDGLNVATKISNLDLDLQNIPANSNRYLDFWEARARVLTAATKFPLSTILTDFNNPSSAQLLGFSVQDGATQNATPTILRGAAVLRPTEAAIPAIYDKDSKVIHAFSPLENSDKKVTTNSMEQQLLSQPVVVELRAKIDLWTPFLDDWIVTAKAAGFREKVPPVPFGEYLEPKPAGLPDISPEPSPSPSPVPKESEHGKEPEEYPCAVSFSELINNSRRGNCSFSSCCPDLTTGGGTCASNLDCSVSN